LHGQGATNYASTQNAVWRRQSSGLAHRSIPQASSLTLTSLRKIHAGLPERPGSLSGVVQDQTGAIVSGATVTLQNTPNGIQRISHSDGSGSFSFEAVLSGDYTLTVQEAGFKQTVRSGIHLNPEDSLSIPDLSLTVGTTSETITVAADTAGLALDSGQLSSTISSSDLERLSIVGRDATELQRTLPGFAIRNLGSTNSAPDFSQVQIGQPTPYASNGAPVAGITLKLDGANLTDAGNFGSSLQNIDDSFVSEVQVQTSNFGATSIDEPFFANARPVIKPRRAAGPRVSSAQRFHT